jgi:hypothetical protein
MSGKAMYGHSGITAAPRYVKPTTSYVAPTL